MGKNSIIYLHDIIQAIETIKRYMKDIDFESFNNNSEKQDAVIRQLQIIGEASNHIDKTIMDKIDEVRWREIIGMRNILIHNYDSADTEEIWNVYKNDLDILQKSIQKFLNTVS